MFAYTGKSIDVFEDVWNMWMRYAGVDAYIHADVLSFRCFAFSCGEDTTEWFSPAQPMEMAITELCNSLGIMKNCSIVPAADWVGKQSELQQPVLLADVCLGVENDTVGNRLYHGIPPCSVLHRHSDGKHLVYTSSGIPFIELSEEQVRDKIAASKGYVVTGEMPLQIRQLSWKEILHRGVQWRKRTADNGKRLERLCPESFERIQSRYSRLAVWYGLMNYQVQLSKVVRFCAQEAEILDSAIEELTNVLLRIAQIYRNQEYEGIVRIEEEFWALIRKIEED